MGLVSRAHETSHKQTTDFTSFQMGRNAHLNCQAKAHGAARRIDIELALLLRDPLPPQPALPLPAPMPI